MRYIIKISYDGSNYSGYQSQKDKITIQDILEKALSMVLRQEIKVVASGRTDAGVSAIEQVCHIDTREEIDNKRTIGYVNTILPKDIRVIDIEQTSDDFHARYSSKRKTYEYMFYVGNAEIPVYERIATHIGYNLNIDAMVESCKYFLGEHDFSAFCASNTEVKDKTRTIYEIYISKVDNNLYKLTITGNGFLYNMVRIIMGTLISVGMNKIDAKDISKIIQARDRKMAGKTAPSKGLYLKNVLYK